MAARSPEALIAGEARFLAVTQGHMVNHLSAVTGVTLAVYALWSMIIDPAKGPLPGTVLPLAVGLLLFAVGLGLLGWGSYRIYGYR